MTKWDYLYAELHDDKVQKVDGRKVKNLLVREPATDTDVTSFLKKMGQEGWEVVGLCPANTTGNDWRLVLKRPLTP